MPAGPDRARLIRKIREEVESLGLRPVRPPVTPERPNQSVTRPSDLAPLIEHTLLRPEATRGEIIALCNEAKRFQFRGVCVNPIFVAEAKQYLAGTACRVVSVIGFPLGANLTATKVDETKRVIALGVDEVDMVIGLGALKAGDYGAVYDDIREVVLAAQSIPVKAILETPLLDDAEKVAACLLAQRAGACYVKSSTGFALLRTPEGVMTGATTVEDVGLMREVVGDDLGIKASGGISDYRRALAMVEAGATRLGCSRSVEIVSG